MRPDYNPPAEGHGREEIVGPMRACTLGAAGNELLEHIKLARGLRNQCESPIEIELGAHLLRLLKGTRVSVRPQCPLHRFRMDFALLKDNLHIVLFIECDGKEFHSSPTQVANDRAKDASAKWEGIPLMRFTGSDIFRQAEACAKLAVNAIRHHL